MRWPWQRRRTTVAPVARHAVPRQSSWAQPAFPPDWNTPAVDVVPVQASGVLLGFADGTQVALDERDPSALALRAVAELLVQDRPD
jgi:hypothetical protein